MTFDLAGIADAIKTLALVFATLVIAYAGLILATSTDPSTREEWKEVIAGVILGLSLLFLAPWLAQQLAGGTYCHA